jgi:hypothetical protein
MPMIGPDPAFYVPEIRFEQVYQIGVERFVPSQLGFEAIPFYQRLLHMTQAVVGLAKSGKRPNGDYCDLTCDLWLQVMDRYS